METEQQSDLVNMFDKSPNKAFEDALLKLEQKFENRISQQELLERNIMRGELL